MGQRQSKQSEKEPLLPNIQNIQDRLAYLEQAADTNRDGLVTRQELEQYTATQLNVKDQELCNLRQELSAAREKNVKMQQMYDEAHRRHEELLEQISKEKADKVHKKDPTSVVSNGAIERFVDELLKDPNINIYLLPDSIEKPIYVNTLKIVLSLLQKSLNHTNLDIIGHEIKMQMQPNLETRLQDRGIDTL